MAISGPVPPPAQTFTRAPESEAFALRWAAWQAKGIAHDRAVRRKTAVVAIALIMVAAVIIVWTLVVA